MTDEIKTTTQAESVLIKLENFWVRRLLGSIAVLLFIFMVAGIILILKNNLVDKKINQTYGKFYDLAAKYGMVLDDIVITGRDKTAKEDLNKLLALKRGDNMLKINVFEVKKSLETLPWIDSVQVRRSFFPNVLHIDIKEKEVKAIWQVNEKFYPLDKNGKIIEAKYQINEQILLIVGKDAPENFKKLAKMLNSDDKDYLQRVKVANFISGRRWNLVLDDVIDGITIKLPEYNVMAAWKKIVKLDEEKGIFKRKLTIIDLRLPNKVVVKLRKNKVGESPKLNKSAEHGI